MRVSLITFSSHFRGINFVMTALVFNVVPIIFEVSLVSGILVRIYFFCSPVVVDAEGTKNMGLSKNPSIHRHHEMGSL